MSGQEKESVSKKEYKEIIVKGFYTFQNDEKPQLLDSLLSIIKLNKFTIKEDSINSKILYLKGVNNLELNRFKKAEDLFVKSFELAEKTNDTFLKGSIYNSRGIIISKAYGNYVKSGEYFKKAIANYNEIDNLSQLIDAYYNLTINARKQLKWQESITYAKSFLKFIVKDGKRIDGVGKMYYFIADNYFELKKNEEALINLKKAESLTIKTDSELYSLINASYAKYYESKGDFTLAIQKYKEVNKNLEETIINDEKRIKASFVKELELESELKDKQNLIINNQETKLIVSGITAVFFIALTIFFIFLGRKNKNKNKQIKNLNTDLKQLISELKINNEDLRDKKNEILTLLNLNEQTLFSRVLKITTYNDTIKKISDDIESYTEQNSEASSYLITVNKKLLSLISEEELWDDFKVQFEKIRPEFFSKLKKIAPSLSVNDLKHCTYIVSNLKSKDVSQLINVSPRSVETTRYRIKKKMGLEKEDNLHDLLSNL
ncbi:tetratricopeptide repeat protein [Tenacibaculum retecalamus]|uniref:tetratricopeptide repeat protein n=1 Tax=Tenacibaculum retecalamus TaxID=3018315 RepID=UPI0023D9473F|nr:hypothetical protein [Tenacibaculum retecalamus]WBX70232.1 hypothetical protein PG912_07990 [Tenacibaculum retecalamus]